MSDDAADRRTALHDLHVELGARMVPFAGFSMPVQYAGTIAEHEHTRRAASLFDVGHMGVATVEGPDAAEALEALTVSTLSGLEPGRSRYTLLTNDRGGIVDDLIVTRREKDLGAVLNAARVDADLAHLRARLPEDVRVELHRDHGLLALQGPAAATVMTRHAPEATELRFMRQALVEIDGVPVVASRSGYTGEDGFELIVANDAIEQVARLLLAEPEVEPAGLGARDSLRLEAGLCLYGNDLDETITPVEADLVWTIPKARREAGGFPGDAVVLRQLAAGTDRVRVGLRLEGRRIARPGAPLHDADGERVGEVTSGAYGPTVGAAVAMGYVAPSHRAVGTELVAYERGKELPARVADLPQHTQR